MILAADINDAPELCALVNGAYRGAESHAGWTTEAHLFEGVRTDLPTLEESLKNPDILILKYVSGSEIIGCMELKTSGDRLYLGMLTVKPQLQGGGIGKKFLQLADEEATKRKLSGVFMTVIPLRTELMDWYERHGYKDSGKRVPFFDADHPRAGIPKVNIELAILEKKL